MKTLLAGLFALVKPSLFQMLAALGMGVITYGGFSVVLDQIRGLIQGNLSSLPTNIAQLIGLFGVHQAMGIILGAYASRITLLTTKRVGVIAK